MCKRAALEVYMDVMLPCQSTLNLAACEYVLSRIFVKMRRYNSLKIGFTQMEVCYIQQRISQSTTDSSRFFVLPILLSVTQLSLRRVRAQ